MAAWWVCVPRSVTIRELEAHRGTMALEGR